MNALKVYDEFLELQALSAKQAREELRGIYRRDFESTLVHVNSQPLKPMPGHAEDLDRVFNHLISRKYESTSRELDRERAKCLHWILPHVTGAVTVLKRAHKVDMFAIKEAGADKLYILNHSCRYQVVLEQLRDQSGYFLLTAFPFDSDREYKFAVRKKGRGTPL